VIALLGGATFFAERITSAADASLYADEVIFSRDTPYQRIVLTRWKDDLRLFLNSHLQFSSRDEYRYHEALVHPGLASLPGAHRVLVMGGGDGLAVREILKYPQIQSVTLVDLDPEMTRLFSSHPVMSALNDHSLTSPRVDVINADAFRWLDTNTAQFDFIVADFPDPTSYALGKLFTTAFYRLASKHLARGGLIVVQSTSPLFARRSYWCIVESVKQAGLHTYPYHVYVPSFGEWGYVIGAFEEWQLPQRLPAGLRFLSLANVRELFVFPVDMQPVPAEPNRLNNQVLVRYYEEEWKDVAH
jgi:spermidine synthase